MYTALYETRPLHSLLSALARPLVRRPSRSAPCRRLPADPPSVGSPLQRVAPAPLAQSSRGRRLFPPARLAAAADVLDLPGPNALSGQFLSGGGASSPGASSAGAPPGARRGHQRLLPSARASALETTPGADPTSRGQPPTARAGAGTLVRTSGQGARRYHPHR